MNQLKTKYLKKNAKQCGHCLRNTLLLSEYELICFSYRYNLIKRKTSSVTFKES